MSNLHQGQRYLFHKHPKYCADNKPLIFRAKFIDILKNTLRVYDYCEINNVILQGMRTMPITWITKIESLDDIVNNTRNAYPPLPPSRFPLPEDILVMIDNYA